MIQYMRGDEMVNQSNIEALFDCLDESATLLYKTYKLSYIDGVVEACENIMSNSVNEEHESIKDELMSLIQKIDTIEFNKEEIRKAFQYACLRGFKHEGISNQMITPDTIGIFINYLISKLYDKQNLLVLDPVLGTGNLITTIANNSDKNMTIMGVDSDSLANKLSNALFDMLDYGDQVYFQDTLMFKCPPTDLLVGDYSGIPSETIFKMISHHASNIISGGFHIGIFDEQKVTPEILVEKSKGLNEHWNLFGYIRLPESMFKNDKKNLVIFQRAGKEVTLPKKMLLVDLPPLSDQTEMTKIISQLNDWFKITQVYKL